MSQAKLKKQALIQFVDLQFSFFLSQTLSRTWTKLRLNVQSFMKLIHRIDFSH